jgi:hypothetical protein
MNTKNDVIVIKVNDLELHRNCFEALQFKITEMGDEQFMAQLNDKIVVVVADPESDEQSEYYKSPRGRGIEIWFSVPDIIAHHEKAMQSGIKIIMEFGNRGYGPVGDYGTISPDGYLFFFSQPD